MGKDIGKHFIVGLSSTELTPIEKQQIKDIQPLGYIFFSRNFKSEENWWDKFNSLLTELRELSTRNNLILSIDHEGGRVNRLPSPVTAFPYAQSYAAYSKQVGKAFGSELSVLGFNLCFAPVLDVDLQAANTVISKRAFATSVEEVIPAALSFAENLESMGILSCGKHFPGHGATIADSHFELPVNNSSLDELLATEIRPFAEYIKAGYQVLMSSHILFPKIDKEYPATLSSVISTEILRNKLNFNGCLISDDLDMKALDKYPQKAVRALSAGVDILLIGGIGNETALTEAQNFKEQILSDSNLDLSKSSSRIDSLLEHLNSLPKIKNGISVLGCKEHINLLNSINLKS